MLRSTLENMSSLSLLGVLLIAAYITHLTDKNSHLLQFRKPHSIQSGSLYNVHLHIHDENFEGRLHIVYGDCKLKKPADAHHELGFYNVTHGAHPERIVWVTPSDTPNAHCLFAFSESESIVGRSSPITIKPPSNLFDGMTHVMNASHGWFQGIDYMKAKPLPTVDASSKNASIAIIGAGMAGLMTSQLLTSIGLHNWHMFESSQRMGGRVRTVYLNGSRPDEYQYQEIGPMRFPVEIEYVGTNESLAFQDHEILHRLADDLNRQNSKNHKELNIKFTPFITERSHSPPDTDASTVQTKELSQSEIYMRSLSDQMFKAHKKALRERDPQWSEGGYLRYELGMKTNISHLLPSNDTSPKWEALFWNEHFATTKWLTMDKGFESLSRAFYPHVVNKTSLGARVEGLKFNEQDNKVAVHWRNDPMQDSLSVKEYDYAVVAAPFSKVRLWHLPKYTPILHRAISDLHYEPSCKVALQYRSRFWEHTDKPIFGGCDPIDNVPGIGSVCYPSYEFNATGPGVVLASYNHGNEASSTAALGTAEHVALVQRAMVATHGNIANEQYQGIYYRHCWGNDEHQAGAWASPLDGQQELFIPSFYQTEYKTIFIGEHTSFTHAWISSALDSAFRGTTQLLLDLGLVDEARQIVETWEARWIKL
ncbi:hypothetical protein N7523_002273 [Penicillium sp. IBT 18751x]|nr:hypothetical protein N7523_002273 [Penicillium sp. IBT 18751x]